jgi:hypothetical protein
MSVFSNPASSAPADAAAYVAALLDLLGDRDPVETLRQTPSAVARVLDAVAADALGVPEAPGKWSIREIVQHLADSELVAGFRLRMVLAHDRPVITGYDQDLWASRLAYREADVREALEQFTVLRRANVRLWAGLGPSDLSRVGLHAERGEESLEHMRKLYAGHDLLHLRQLARVRASQQSA